MDLLSIELESIALLIFVVSVFFSLYSRNRAERSKNNTGKKIRELYRRSWIESTLHHGNLNHIVDVIRNSIMVSVALISAIVIAFGLFVSGGTLNGNFLIDIKLILIILLLVYSLFMILLEIRTLIYIPIVAGTNQKLINAYEKKSKIEYLSKLLDSAFDHFSNATRTLFYAVMVLIWFTNTLAFILATVVLTWFMIREDFDIKSRIGIF